MVIQEIKDYTISDQKNMITYLLKGKPYRNVIVSNMDFVREHSGIFNGKKVRLTTIIALDVRIVDYGDSIIKVRVRDARLSKEQYEWMRNKEQHDYLMKQLEILQQKYNQKIDEIAEIQLALIESKNRYMELHIAMQGTVEEVYKERFERAKEKRVEIQEEGLDIKKEFEEATKITTEKIKEVREKKERKIRPITVTEYIRVEISEKMYKLLHDPELRFNKKVKQKMKKEKDGIMRWMLNHLPFSSKRGKKKKIEEE